MSQEYRRDAGKAELRMAGIVHIVGTGTIGEPLIGLMADNQEAFGIDEVTFHKRTPLLQERGKVNDLVRRGAHLSVDADRWTGFEELGHAPKLEAWEAIRAGDGGDRLHARRQREQGEVLPPCLLR